MRNLYYIFVSCLACGYASAADCPTGFSDHTNTDILETTFSLPVSGACSTGFTLQRISDSIQYLACATNQVMTELGTCATVCDKGATSINFKMPNGQIYSFPLYTTATTSPALAVQLSGGKCNVNLVSGSGTNALNIEYGNTVYHTVR